MGVFNPNRVYGFWNKKDIPVGSKVVYADNLDDIVKEVLRDSEDIYELNYIYTDSEVSYPFGVADSEWKLVYPIELPKPNGDVPCLPYDSVKDMLEILSKEEKKNLWLKKKDIDFEYCITGYDYQYNTVLIGDTWISLNELFEEYTFLDGTPCGKPNIF